jgi:parallel beta-helix repeat protein
MASIRSNRKHLIDGAVAIGASDAGIYVGQSRNVVVQNSRAEFNVAGIEIENTIGADVHDNLATNNTGGILIFNMPDLPQPGHNTRVFNNKVIGNNTEFRRGRGAVAESRPAPASSSTRTTMLKFSTTKSATTRGEPADFQLFQRHVPATDHRPVVRRLSRGISVFNNTFPRRHRAGAGHTAARSPQMFGDVGDLPDIIWDGRVDTAKFVEGRLPDALSICIDNGTSEIVNTDSANDFANPKIETDAHRCSIERLPAITLPDVLTAL